MSKKTISVTERPEMTTETMNEGSLILNGYKLQFENITIEQMIETDEISDFEFAFTVITHKGNRPIRKENKKVFMDEYKVNKKKSHKFSFETDEYIYDVNLKEA